MADGRRAQGAFIRMAKPQKRGNHPSILEGKDGLGACALCAGSAVGAVSARGYG